MIGISIAANREWRWVLERYKITSSDCQKYPFGEYFKENLFGEDLIIYKCGHKKIMKDIFDNYLKFALENHFDYVENNSYEEKLIF